MIVVVIIFRIIIIIIIITIIISKVDCGNLEAFFQAVSGKVPSRHLGGP
jgi:hypothetical protein